MGLSPIRRELLSTAAHVWVDIETTGLSVEEDLLLEVALAVTDKDGQILAEYDRLIDHPMSSDELVGSMDEHVESMHVRSGLLTDWERMHRVNVNNGLDLMQDITVAEMSIMNWLTVDCELDPGKFAMSGNSIQFDRSFLEHHMPSVFGFFHYRNCDISTLKHLCRMHNEPVFKAYEKLVADNAQELVHHRALDDVKSSIQEYIFYKDNFLFVA